jgi:[acyl-carrier-protein] S-malonyltransferase
VSVALLFSPQGSQAVGMGRDLADASPAAAAVYAEADEALGWAVSNVCWIGPEDRLNDTRQTQPCLVATSLACVAALREACAEAGGALVPALVAGHSVGEYAAIAAAGAVSSDDALRLVAQRASLMADAGGEGGMAAVIGLNRAAIEDVLQDVAPRGTIVVANDNAPGQVVISGTGAALAAVEAPLRAAGARRLIALRVSGPFHSPAMASVGEALAAAFKEVAWSNADPPIVSNVIAEPVSDANRIRELLARQVSSPVEWVASVRRMLDEGVDTFVECGPGAALTGMVRRIAPEATTLNVSDPSTLQQAVAALTAAEAMAPAEASV